jgi:hypothetical protein
MTTPDIAGLCERLRAVESSQGPSNWSDIRQVTTKWYRNPDGPKAAKTLERQAAEIERLRGALEKISKGGPDTNRPPRPKYTDGFDEGCAWAGRLARAALTGEDTARLGLSGKTQTDDRTRGDG